jgi:hypothetical protein
MNVRRICFGGIPLTHKEKRLKSYKVKDGVRLICNGAFCDCKKLERIELPSSLNFIGDNAFARCYLLNEIILPDSLLYVGDGAFDCDSPFSDENRTQPLHITIPSSVEMIAGNPFCYNTIIDCHNERFKLIDNSLYSADGKVLISCCSKKQVFTVPTGVERIGRSAFLKSPIEKVVLPPTLRIIDKYAFYGASCRVNDGVFPESLEEIRDKAFYGSRGVYDGCISFPSNVIKVSPDAFDFEDDIMLIRVPKGRIDYYRTILPECVHHKICDEDVVFDNGLYLNKDKTELIAVSGMEGDYIIPEGITKIRDRAFGLCFDSVTFPASLKDFTSNIFDSEPETFGEEFLMAEQIFVPSGTIDFFSERLPKYKDIIEEIR